MELVQHLRTSILVAVALVVASACSAPSTDSAATPSVAAEPATGAVAAGAPQVEFEASFDFLDEAAERMAATPHRFEAFISDEAVMVGESDGTWSTATLGLETEELAAMISNGTDFYMELSALNQVFPELNQELLDLGLGDGWVLLRPDEVEARLGEDVAPTMTPATFVSADDIWADLRDPISIAEGPSSSIRGVESRTIVVEVQRFEFSTDVTSTFVIHVDSSGHVRSIGDDFSRVVFFDFGDPDIAVKPPTNATDITQDWIAAVETRQGDRGLLDGTMSRVPSVLTLTGSEASSAIERAGLEPWLEQVTSDTAPRGEVVGQQPVAGTVAETGSVVVYQVSIGNVVLVPDVRGLEVAAARELLLATGFIVPSQYTVAFDQEIERDLVVGTVPETGEIAPQGSEITIVLSNGPEG